MTKSELKQYLLDNRNDKEVLKKHLGYVVVMLVFAILEYLSGL